MIIYRKIFSDIVLSIFRKYLLALICLPILLIGGCGKTNTNPAKFISDLEVLSISLDGEKFRIQRGYLNVPEYRAGPKSDVIQVAFYRIPGRNSAPTPPIFVLPGGPGVSFLEELVKAAEHPHTFDRQQLQFLREHYFDDLASAADVIIMDQRGAGLSKPKLICDTLVSAPTDHILNDADFRRLVDRYLEQCVGDLRYKQRNLLGYSVHELVEDVYDLRSALGYDHIQLMAGSFGSQWGLAVLQTFPDLVERFAFWGLEPLDYAYDSPSGVFEALAAIYDDISSSVGADNQTFSERLSIKLQELKRAPSMTLPSSEDTSFYMGPKDLQYALFGTADYSARDRKSIANWYQYINHIFDGDYTATFPLLEKRRRLDGTDSPTPQFLSIDCGLGISWEREQQLQQDPAAPLLGDVNRLYFTACPKWPGTKVSEAFKRPHTSMTQGLFIQGTWDTSTPLKNATDISEFFPNAKLVLVERATHRVLNELYREKPTFIRPILQTFFSGKSVTPPSRIALPPILVTPR